MARRTIALVGLGLSSLALTGFSPDAEILGQPTCADGVCTTKLTGAQLLDDAQRLVLAHRYDEAKPLLIALAQDPKYRMETDFLDGYVAEETGDLNTAAHYFRLVLQDRPDVTRARLELARVLMLQGKDDAADYNYRIASKDKDLPPEIAKTISDSRDTLRNRRRWHLNVDFDLVPDSNVNNATDARAIDVTLGNTTLPLQLDNNARRQSGLGQSVSVSSGIRFKLRDNLAMLVDADGQFVNQKGSADDDASVLVAAGPEYTFKDGTRLSVEALMASRWFGGKTLTRGPGARTNFQKNLSQGSRIGLQVDVRHNSSYYGGEFAGWQVGAYGSYEHIVDHTMVASLTLFGVRQSLGSAAYSNTEAGFSAGIGGELPRGINAGISGGVSRAWFDAPMAFLSPEPRRDWKPSFRAYAGLRSIKVAGFSPSVTYTYNASLSSIPLYKTTRSRVLLGISRYF
ncbi:MAG: DUF560 domain-containing protein [Sphingomonadaceae bacterium]|nr:DUF560 domain-containing protein [Sphingomonadaceae bacterium]